MRWTDATLKNPVEYGSDELGNKTVTHYERIPVKVRLTNWTVEEKAGLDPEYTRTTRKAILRQPKALTADYIEINGASYQIVDRYDLERWQLLHIRSYKQ